MIAPAGENTTVHSVRSPFAKMARQRLVRVPASVESVSSTNESSAPAGCRKRAPICFKSGSNRSRDSGANHSGSSVPAAASRLVLGIFACTSVLLVALGVYGVLAYTVSQQTREIAIRVALGGDRGHVVRMVLRLGLRLVGTGLVIGVAARLATNRLLVSQLWNTSPTDPLTFLIALSVVLVIGALACWVPATRAVRVEPMVALRHE